ncbi:MAG: hypothetical protein OJF49_004492 [Ktedonobacterales bacterium]|jgi:hypothetical protein|nr:MAG: hypothetical protein OJF49_004492 [Ktedonobacterales bacterium]
MLVRAALPASRFSISLRLRVSASRGTLKIAVSSNTRANPRVWQETLMCTAQDEEELCEARFRE